MTYDDIKKIKDWLEEKDKDNPLRQGLLDKLNDKNLDIGKKTAIITRNINPKILRKILFGGLNEQKTKKS